MLNKIETQLAKIRKLRQEIASVLNISYEQRVSASFDAKRIEGRKQKEIRVAAIMDRFTLDCFQPECILTELTPQDWRAEMEQAKPDLLFIESAWQGKDGLWHGKVNHCSVEISELTEYCHERSIPVVFWNKEDPVYTDVFMNTARCADIVFTTDMECIQKYKTELGHDRVYHIHFAAQPKTHNPIEKYERKDKFCFAGAYYHRYEQRCKIFDAFSKHFIETRGLDVYDRNYPSPRPEHKFPDFYNPYILGRLDPSEIDVAYKGYTFGINMNSVTQSQTMFARRVFELLASNTVVVGNYSRGVKNYFGDLTICTDDAKTLKNTLEQYCCDEDTRDRYRLLGLRKVLTEHLCEDRLDEIIQKVYGVSVKPELPMVTVLAHASNQKDLEKIQKAFDRQCYENKKLVLITDEQENVRPGETVYQPEQFASISLSEICKNGYLAYFAHDDWYGENYLLDLVLTTRYGSYNVIGKAAYFTGNAAGMQNRKAAYRPADCLMVRRSIISADCLGELTGAELSETTEWKKPNMVSTDGFQYCESWIEDSCAKASDLEVFDQGIPKTVMDETAERIMPMLVSFNAVKIDANEICDVKIPNRVPLTVKKEDKYAVITSNLPEGQHHYVYLKRKIPVADLIEDGKITVHFRGNGNLSLVCGCVFYDAAGNKLDVKYPKLGRKEQIEVPANADCMQLLYRPRESGIAKLECVELGGCAQGGKYGDCYLLRSNVLILSNHYPSYDALYRNMFVHKRVMGYKEKGYIFDIFRMHVYATPQFREFEGINVLDGYREELLGILSSGRIDTICIHFLDREMWEILKPFIGKIRLIVWLHGAEIQPWWRREYNYHTKAELDDAKRVSDERMAFWKEVFSFEKQSYIHYVFVSQYFCDEIFEDNKIQLDPSQYSIIHNCIDTEQFTYEPKDAEQRKKILSIRPYQSDKYANDLSAKAILELAKEPWFSELDICMIGNGPLFDEILAPLKKFPNVQCRQEFLTQGDIAELHKKYGIFLTPTRMDAQGVSRDEAMSSGLVPVTNAVTAIPEFVDETCGILAPAEDFVEMAAGIKKLYENPDLFLQMSKNAAARVRSQTSKEYTIYKELDLIVGKSSMDGESRNLSIFGSCVTRDIFRIASNSKIHLKSYIARQSVVSAVSKSICIDYNAIQLSSEFQKKVVWNDFIKNTFDLLKSDESEWLMIDFIDERLPVLAVDNSYITKSAEAVNGNVIPQNSSECPLRFDGKEYYRGEVSISQCLREFCKQIRQIYATNRIIIHRAKCVTKYVSKDGTICSYSQKDVKFANNVNKLLDYMYDILVKEFPDAHMIDCMDETYGSENHVWGLSIVHYEDTYYKHVMEKLNEIIK